MVNLGVMGACALDQCTMPAVGGRRVTKPFLLGAPKKPKHGEKFTKCYSTGISGGPALEGQKRN